MRRPEETSRWFAKTADGILAQVALAGKAGRPSKEFQSTVTDLKILAGLARYHSRRLLAGVSYNLYKETGDLESFDDAIAYEKKALAAWGQIVAAAGDVYSENLAFGAHAVGFSRHWKEEQQLLARDFEQPAGGAGEGRRQAWGARTTRLARRWRTAAPPPCCPAKGTGDRGAGATAPAGVKSVRLRYRHVTQYEDYQTAEMTLDAKTGSTPRAFPRASSIPNGR